MQHLLLVQFLSECISPQIKNYSPREIFLWAVAAYGLGTIGFGISTSFISGLVFLAVLGAGDMISTIIRQQLTPPILRGRVLFVISVFFLGGPFLGDAEAGFVAGFLGAPLSVITGGIAMLLFTVGIAWKVSKLRNYQGDEFIAQ